MAGGFEEPGRGAPPGGAVASALPFVLLAGVAAVLPRWAEGRQLYEGVVLLAGGAALAALLVAGTWRLVQEGGAEERRSRRATAEIVLLSVYMTVALFALLPFLPALPPEYEPLAVVAVLAVSFGGTLVIWIWVALRFLPALRSASTPGTGSGPRPDPSGDHWRWGVLYHDRRDPRLFVAKRFGLGYTINTAHPTAWLGLAALLAIPLAMVLLLLL